jgi:GT2 family glycosyltransferase/glycosyltransferase involved in cell wall biosynthesis
MNQSIICIAGAHRSGTSMLARLLHRSGLDLGPESALMPGASDNPDGFWENLRFVALNDEILNAVGAAWDLPPLQNEAFDSASIAPIHAKAELLIADFQEKATWGWKDPRNCLTIRFWNALIPELKTLLIIRNPLEVAYSMHKRNGTSYALALRLWEIYNRRLLATTQPGKRLIVHYHDFFQDPGSVLEKIAEFAGLHDGQVRAAAELVALNRRHTAFTIEQLIDAGVSSEIVALYRSLLEAHIGRCDVEKQPALASTAQADRLFGAENKLNTSIPDGEDIRRELATRRGAEIQHQEEIGRYRKTIEDLRRELAANSVRATAEISRRDGRIEELQKAYAHLDQLLRHEQNQRNELWAEKERLRHEAEQAREEVAKQATRYQKLQKRLADKDRLLQDLGVRQSDLETYNASLVERLRKQLLEMKRLLRLLDQIEEASRLLQRSRRWKCANPIAAILAAVTDKPLKGFGHLDKNIEKYRAWRTAHPETINLEEQIQILRSREIPSPATSIDRPAFSRQAPSLLPPNPGKPIEFPRHETVEVSIIIPVHNQISFTRACLGSIQEQNDELSIEVIVVDDCSTDATAEEISRLPGLVYLQNATNEGFIAACNRGASIARGEYLVFLNNDTIVTKGWLANLRDTFLQEAQAGLVGSKLVYPDGRLQEAGGIIWRDASGWNRGKFEDPSKPEYNYLRQVDYCSAASIMVRQSTFKEVAGFDPKYAPAYYEDTDLAFKIAQRGLKVLYQPLSEVIHYEGVTSGTDTATGTKKHQTINREIFLSTWRQVLAGKPNNGDLEAFDRPREGKKRVLVIDHHLPTPDRDSGSLRMSQILEILHGLGHRVTFIPDNLANISPYTANLQKRGIEVVYYPYLKSVREYLERNGRLFDVIILSRCDFARKHIGNVRAHASQARVIFDTVDLHFLREAGEAALTRDPAIQCKATEKEKLEFSLIDETDETWVVSEYERDLLRHQRPGKSIQIVSNIVEAPGSSTPFSLRRGFLFIGSFQHPPNLDAVIFFAREVYPLIRNRLPTETFFIIGGNPPPAVLALASEHVVVTGFQADVRPFFDGVKLSVAPLRWGAGVKGKINQSMGYGVPVVTTSVGAEGMRLTDREEILIADDPQSFARAMIELYESEELWTRISEKGLAKTRAMYSTEAARASLSQLLGEEHLQSFSSPGHSEVKVTSRGSSAGYLQAGLAK